MLLLFMDLLTSESDRDRFRILYDEYHQFLFYIARQILSDDYLAEDAVQNAYLTALHHLKDFKDPHSAASRNLLITITRSRSIDLYRKHSQHRTEVIPFEPQAEGDLLDRLLQTEDILLVKKAIRSLSPEDRSVIEYFYLHEFPIKKIAVLTHTTEKNVSVRLSRARKRLGLILQKIQEEQLYGSSASH